MGETIIIDSLEAMCSLMCDNQFSRKTKTQDDYEACWQTGIYEDYVCELCPHNFECSGYHGDDDDED